MAKCAGLRDLFLFEIRKLGESEPLFFGVNPRPFFSGKERDWETLWL